MTGAAIPFSNPAPAAAASSSAYTSGVYTSDTFDGRSSLGTTTDAGLGGTAQTWASMGTMMTVSSGALAGSVAFTQATVNTSYTNCSVSVKVTALPVTSHVGIIIRSDGALSSWTFHVGLNAGEFYYYLDPNSNEVALNVAASVNDVMKVVTNGSSIKLYVNGTLLTTLSDTLTSTNTRFGLEIVDTIGKLDNFIIEDCT